MHTKAALLTLALAISALVPAASAVDSTLQSDATATAAAIGDVRQTTPSVEAVEPTVATDPVVDAAASLAQPPLDEIDVSVSAHAQATVDVPVVGPGAAGVAVGTVAARGDAPASFGARAANVAAVAAAPTLVALGLGALALGGNGLRLVQSRVSGLFGRALRAAGAAIPLFSRIERCDVLDNPVRARVLDAVAQEPGLSLSEVTQRAGIAWGTAVHHLRLLERHRLVVSVRELAHHRYFAADTPAAAQRAAVSVVLHPTARRIAEFVAQRPGTDQAGICRALRLNNPSASKHLSQFESRGLVQSQRVGRSRLYQATVGLHSALLLLDPASAPATGTPALASPVAIRGVA
jgi:DNA-binding transcriptional ArsR family regulator